MTNNLEKYCGYVVYCNDNHPIGVVSSNGERAAICNLAEMPKNFGRYLTAIEDKRFYSHAGIDPRGIVRALVENIKAGKIVQGGSTVTQQLARNILRDNRRTVTRKVRETLLALNIERNFSKEHILESYCNRVYWGRNIYGIRAASLEYFGKEPHYLTTSEQLVLITLLRGPNFYLANGETLKKRYHLLSRALRTNKVLSSRKYSRARKARVQLDANRLQVFRNDSINYIAERIDQHGHSIVSSLDKTMQNQAASFISECKYPTSLICIGDGQVLAAASSLGSDYPFTFRANVGSTLKPFVYTFLRENGIRADGLLATKSNCSLTWSIGEVQPATKDFVTLREALKLSNNNAFVNASYAVGIEKVQSFLARTLNRSDKDIVAASVLGATVGGMSLYELITAYYRFFAVDSNNSIKKECVSALQEIAAEKFETVIDDLFLKTGTTNKNMERYGIVGLGRLFFGFLRQGNETNDYSKEGNFMSNILNFLRRVRKKVYKWD